MPLQATSGAASYDAFGGGVPVVPAYIEEVFSTYLYTGNSTARSIVNNIDLSTKGGLVWIKNRSDENSHILSDTARGITNYLSSDVTSGQASGGSSFVTTANTDGFSLGVAGSVNFSSNNYVSWTFREQPKFFDVVTWTGDGTGDRQISHNLGSTPGCVIAKRTSSTSFWSVYHRGVSGVLYLNSTDSAGAVTDIIAVSATTFTVDFSRNASGSIYVAYLFAHDAGGFGLTGTDNVISCGSWSASGNDTITLGYEPQWLLLRKADGIDDWQLFDNMRGLTTTTSASKPVLYPNLSIAEDSLPGIGITSTGFNSTKISGTYIYIAIRRGPMKVPTSGTSVFAPVLNTGTGANTNISSGSFAPDMLWNKTTDHAYGTEVWDKLRGVRAVGLTTSNTGAEGLSPAGYDLVSFNNTGVTEGANSGSVMNITSWLYVNYMFGRAPSFFDEVCWTGTGSGSQAITHNLNAVPEFTITKRRSGTGNWSCFPVMFGVNTGIYLDSTAALQTNAALHPTLPTSTTYYTNDASWGDENIGGTFVTYLFATCAGVSKVGSYTGTGTTLQVNCGFTGGARFVLIKKTSGTGSWYVWDSARGIVSGNDPYLLLNSTAAEVTNTDYIDTYSAGFEISSTAPSEINESGGTFIFFAVA